MAQAHLLPSSSLFENAISRSDRLVGSASRQTAEQFREARLVRIAHGTLAVGLDPFGMLDPQIVVNLLPEFSVSVNLVIHGNCRRKTNFRRSRYLLPMGPYPIRSRGGPASWLRVRTPRCAISRSGKRKANRGQKVLVVERFNEKGHRADLHRGRARG